MAIADAVKVALGADGHAADIVGDGRQALEWAATYAYDLVILDVILPGLDGFAVCASLAEDGFAGAVLMLTALDDVQDRITGLDQGADDYLAKPFSMGELLAGSVRSVGDGWRIGHHGSRSATSNSTRPRSGSGKPAGDPAHGARIRPPRGASRDIRARSSIATD